MNNSISSTNATTGAALPSTADAVLLVRGQAVILVGAAADPTVGAFTNGTTSDRNSSQPSAAPPPTSCYSLDLSTSFPLSSLASRIRACRTVLPPSCAGVASAPAYVHPESGSLFLGACEYLPEVDTWQSPATAGVAKVASHAARAHAVYTPYSPAAVDPYVFAFGGETDGRVGDRLVRVTIQDGSIGEVPRSDPWPGPRADAVMVPLNQTHLLLSGGRGEGGAAMRDWWVFDAGKLRWTQGTPRMAQGRFGHRAVVYDERFVIQVGGWFDSEPSALIECLDLETGTTTLLPNARDEQLGPAYLAGHNVLIAGDQLVVLGGYAAWNHSSTPTPTPNTRVYIARLSTSDSKSAISLTWRDQYTATPLGVPPYWTAGSPDLTLLVALSTCLLVVSLTTLALWATHRVLAAEATQARDAQELALFTEAAVFVPPSVSPVPADDSDRPVSILSGDSTAINTPGLGAAPAPRFRGRTGSCASSAVGRPSSVLSAASSSMSPATVVTVLPSATLMRHSPFFHRPASWSGGKVFPGKFSRDPPGVAPPREPVQRIPCPSRREGKRWAGQGGSPRNPEFPHRLSQLAVEAPWSASAEEIGDE
ncbi:hypothetical protein AMAG_06630 [Allomyces macrogynus ATCC 38327]|uniref:Galactose oxidase n=1 Tax=Allomyces macrogynus (strain ATCC 38327) TaxID=578462 RepID=A0A0L0SEJ4_ALLM3|nr:hypothetical protein AMAG_06630 [Allomyces macrogynus ATCC 38327]|eukprot:KNE60867.1 hypothetical protein AMAG_06630 [Allomyces macrogynus ATCC 38327]